MLEIENLTINDPKAPLTGLSFTFEPGNIYTILGRTGAGKTELLRALMGLTELDTGDVTLDGKSLAQTAIRDRSMALVYQQFINYPHLSVLENVEFPLRRQGKSRKQARNEANKMLHTVGLDEFTDRRPAQLSGGQQQRVALARAMVKNSRILMLDEPLANLDYKLREQLREEFPRLLHGNNDSVILYTTTEPREAMQLGDTMIVMHKGRIVATGDPAELFDNPPTIECASVISDPPISFVDGFAKSGKLFFSSNDELYSQGIVCPDDGPLTIALRPDAIVVGGDIPAKISLAEFSGSETIVHLELAFGRATMSLEGIEEFPVGEELDVSILPEKIMLFAADGKNITKREM